MGYRPLHRAAQSGSLQLLDSLITTHGCHVDATAKNGQTALWIAADAGHTSAVANLLEHGARVTNPQPARPSITPLHAAAKHGHVDAVKLLLARGAPVSELSTERYTALHFVCGVSSTPREDAISTAKLLLAHGATPLTTAVNDEQPLHAAAHTNAHELVTLLLQHGATLDVPNTLGETPLHIAAHKSPRCFQAMLQHEEQARTLAHKPHSFWRGVLESATWGGMRYAMRTLLPSTPTDEDAPDSTFFSSALLIAAEAGRVEPIELLIHMSGEARVQKPCGRRQSAGLPQCERSDEGGGPWANNRSRIVARNRRGRARRDDSSGARQAVRACRLRAFCKQTGFEQKYRR